MKQMILNIDENGSIDLTPYSKQSVHKSVVVSKDEISIETGSVVGDITISIIIGAVVIGSIFAYGYFFGTRNTEEKIQAAVKAERLKVLSDRIIEENL